MNVVLWWVSVWVVADGALFLGACAGGEFGEMYGVGFRREEVRYLEVR